MLNIWTKHKIGMALLGQGLSRYDLPNSSMPDVLINVLKNFMFITVTQTGDITLIQQLIERPLLELPT